LGAVPGKGKKQEAWVKMLVMSRFRYQETLLGVGFAWILAPFGFTLAGFYFGTIWNSDTHMDLQLPDVLKGCTTGLIGLAVGIAFAIVVTAVYPSYINREYREMEEHAHHH
jgi:hypothetical protein